MNLRTWAAKWGVPMAALMELEGDVLGLHGTAGVEPTGKTEAHAQSLVRLEAPHHDVLLFRNNVGALKDDTGRVVRYGLANDSAALNERLKSADLIGVSRKLITLADVGEPRGQLVSRECKESGWVFTGTAREQAQLAWASLLNTYGADAKFATGPGSFT